MRAALVGVLGRLTADWQRLPAARRRLAVYAIAIIGGGFFMWFLQTLDHAHTALATIVDGAAERAQAALLEQRAVEFTQLRARPPLASATVDLRALVQTELNAAGLAAQVDGLEVLEGGRVRVALATVAFADWLSLLERLQSQQVLVEVCSVQTLAMRGRVQASATLTLARRR